MKIKSYLLATVFAITLFSCSKDNESTIESNTATKKQVLNFSSEKEMQAKIAEIESFKKNQEAQILEKLLKRNNLKTPTVNDVKNIENANSNVAIDKKAILEDVKFYHQEKLNAIYAERAHFGFTSIQSIADEINFTKLINHDKSNQLFDNYKSLLIKNDNETSTILNTDISNLISTKGELFLINKNIARNYLKKDKNSSSICNARVLNSGWLAAGYNNFVVITHSADVEDSSRTYQIALQGGGSVTHTDYLYKTSTTLSCFILSAYGYVLYPCYFYTNPTSYAAFYISSITNGLGFGGGYGSYTIVSSKEYFYSSYNNMIAPQSVSGLVSGNFAVPVAGTSNFLWVSDTKNF